MQSSNRILDDLARVAGGAVGTLSGMRAEMETLIRQRIERMLAGMDLVPRDEFEAVKEMAAKARAENEVLSRRVAALEAAQGKPGKAKTTTARPRTRRAPTAAAAAPGPDTSSPESTTPEPPKPSS